VILPGLILTLLQAPTPAVGAQQPAVQQAQASGFDALRLEYTKAEELWTLSVRAAAADLEKRKQLAKQHPARDFAARFQAQLDKGEARALLWQATTMEHREEDRAKIVAFKRDAFAKLVETQADAPWCIEIPNQLSLQRSWIDTEFVLAQLESFAARTKNKEAAAQALLKCYGIRSGYSSSGEQAEIAAKLREKLKTEYKDTQIGKRLADEDFRLQHLVPGKPAPDFTARDVDGVEFKLSDYKGKVVLLDFWGFW
jgi:hypothetical protein